MAGRGSHLFSVVDGLSAEIELTDNKQAADCGIALSRSVQEGRCCLQFGSFVRLILPRAES